MSTSEKILESLLNIQVKNDGSLFDAAIEFCDVNDIDIEELIQMIDSNTKQRIKDDCIDNKMVQKRFRPTRERNLFDF